MTIHVTYDVHMTECFLFKIYFICVFKSYVQNIGDQNTCSVCLTFDCGTATK